MKTKNAIALLLTGICALFLLIFSFMAFRIITVRGNEMAVKESWSHGVEDEPYGPKTYFMFPGWSQRMFVYDLSSQVFTMNDECVKDTQAYYGKESDSYTVQSREGQDMKISLSVRWHINPTKLVELHKTVKDHIEEKIIRPTLMLIIKNEATQRTAIEAFSGDGLVQLQMEIQKELISPEGELVKRGIIVENFVIEKIDLDKDYIGQIRARQVATQMKLRAEEETKAARAMADKAKEEARADFNKRVVEAERDKAVGILKAEEDKQKQVLAAQGKAEQVTLAAEADKRRAVLAAEGEMEAGVNRAKAIEAIGKAEADATKLRMSAYSAPGTEAYVKMEVAKAMGNAFSGIKGYLPADMRVTVLSDNFMQTVEKFMGDAGKAKPQAHPEK